VLDQTYKDSEIIIVDDCSTDNSEEVVRSFKDPRIQFSKNQKNLGMVPNTNKAVKLARGEFVGILHPDDYYDPKMIETALKMFDKNPEIGFTCSSYAVVDEDDKIVTKVKLCDCNKTFSSKEGFKKLAIRNFAPPSAVLFKTKCYEDVGPFDEEFPYPNDWNMWLRISLKYGSACLSDCLCYYRIHESSVSTFLYNSFETAVQEYYMLKKIQKQVDDLSLLPFVEEGRKRAAKRALLNSVGGLFRGGRNKALKFFSKALKLEKRNLVWPPALVCPFIILAGWNGLRVSANLYKKLPRILKQFIPFHDLETLFYRYGL
jgi:glycosyltransferase involved in cell wall biosynthesis